MTVFIIKDAGQVLAEKTEPIIQTLDQHLTIDMNTGENEWERVSTQPCLAAHGMSPSYIHVYTVVNVDHTDTLNDLLGQAPNCPLYSCGIRMSTVAL